MTDAPNHGIAPEQGNDIEAVEGETAPPPFFELSRLMVVAIDSAQGNKLVWKAQDAPNGVWGGSWTPINDTSYIVLGTGCTTDGFVAMVAQTTDNPTVQYIDEAPEGPNGEQRWNPPVDLGLPEGVAGLVQLIMARDADGRIEAFGVDGQTGNVWWIYQNPPKIVEKTEEVIPPGQTEPIKVHVMVPEPPDQPWSAWQTLPGVAAGRLSLANNADGRIVLVATGQEPDGKTVHVNQQSTGKSLTQDDWTGWSRIDTPVTGPSIGQPAAALDNEGTVNVFMICQYDQIAQLRQSSPGALTWGDWIRPGMTDGKLANLTTALDGDGHLILMAVDDSQGLFANFQESAIFQIWSGWRKIGIVPGFGALATGYNADGKVSFFTNNGSDDSLSMLSQAALDSTAWDAGFTLLGESGLFTYGVVRDLTPPEHG